MKIDNVLINVGDYSTQKYIDYAVAVTVSRALPYVHDGLKPVHRRILYAMLGLGIKAKDKPKKSARIVGDVIGKYHPHGDGAVYEAMVGMAQDWNMRYPLVASQGNFGSRDGDGAAAMRYTEAGLTPYAEEVLLNEIREGTSDFVPNFDGSMTEVVLLGSRLNNLLLNGSFGIAVGMATKIPPHNIRDLTNATMAYIENNNITIPELVEHLQAPDFATGGQIITPKNKIVEAYETGRGGIKIRCRWEVQKLPRGQWQIVVTELPPNQDVVKILKTIDKITNPPMPKDKNGKTASLSGNALKEKMFLTSILANATNQTDKSSLRLVLEPRSSKQDPVEFMSLLYARIGLEESFNFNLTMVDINNTPKTMNIKEIIAEWVDYRKIVVRRRLNFHLEKAIKRLHILDGRLSVYFNLDKAIEIIRVSEDPKADLIKFFELSEIQADDILEIKLRQLAKLEKDKLEAEHAKITAEKEKIEKILGSDARFMTLIKKEIEEITKKFEDDRRTIIEEAQEAIAKSSDSIIEEPVTTIYTKYGWLTLRKGHNVDTSTIALKEGDSIEKIIECKTTDKLGFLASDGRGYSIKMVEIPSGKNFVHVKSLIDCGDANVVEAMLGSKDDKYLFANSSGYGFISSSENLIAKNKAGKHFMSMPSSATVFKPIKFSDEMTRVNALTSDNRVLSFFIDEIKELDKGKGVQIARLKDDNFIKDISITKTDELPVYIKDKKKIYRDEELSAFNSRRGLRGKSVDSNLTLAKD